MAAKEGKHTAPPRYDEAFRAGAVRMVTEQGRPSREVAKELGICIDTLRKLHDQALKRRLLALHEKYPALGLDSLYHLIRKDLSCSRRRIRRLMNELHIFSLRKYANLLARNFSFALPGMAWVSDITYIPTDEGWLYLAMVKDPLYQTDRWLRFL